MGLVSWIVVIQSQNYSWDVRDRCDKRNPILEQSSIRKLDILKCLLWKVRCHECESFSESPWSSFSASAILIFLELNLRTRSLCPLKPGTGHLLCVHGFVSFGFFFLLVLIQIIIIMENTADTTMDSIHHGSSPSTTSGITGNDTLRRAKSLSRPERQRPRQGILRSTANGPGHPSPNTTIYRHNHPKPLGQPMPDQLAQQLAQHRKNHIRQQRTTTQGVLKQDADIASDPANQRARRLPHDRKSQGRKHRSASAVRTGSWAWFAFLITCCFPSCCIRVCFGKSNAMMRQAWREKVKCIKVWHL